MPTTKPAASVTSLLSDKIDHLECSLSRRIDDMDKNLGQRISDLSSKVQTQNGRVGKLEGAHAEMEREIAMHVAGSRAAQRAEASFSKRQMAALFGSGGVVGAVALELVKHILGQ